LRVAVSAMVPSANPSFPRMYGPLPRLMTAGVSEC